MGALLCLLSLWLPRPLGAQVGTADVASQMAALLAEHGIRPVEPPSPATDFRLPLIAGGEAELSSFAGDWVVLTFFATWCAPCVSELPTLEQLSRELGASGLAVVGVSIDSRRELLPPFLERLGIGFPVFWDEEGRAARDYRAQSIPISYVIDPQGRIVGVTRGARDWSQLATLFAELLRLDPATPEVQTVYADGGGEVSLPIRLTPPTATLALDRERPRVGEPFHLDVRVQWAGNFDEYLLHPPGLEVPEGVVEEGISARTGGADGRSIVTYRVALRGREIGSFALDPVELRYTPRFESSPMSSRIEGPTVEIRGRTVAGLPLPAFLSAAAGSAAAGLLAWVVIARRRRRQAGPAKKSGSLEAWDRAVDSARRRRLEGDHRQAFELLAGVELELLDEGDEERRCELRDAIERARFGGEAPPADELDRLLRRVERRLDERRPDPERHERESVMLREAAGDS